MAKVKSKKSVSRKQLFPSGVTTEKVRERNRKHVKVQSTKLTVKSSRDQSKKEHIPSSTFRSTDNSSVDKTYVLEFDDEDKRKVIFTKEQMENWKPMSEELFDNMAKTIQTAKQLILNRSHGLYHDSVKTAMNTSEKRLLATLEYLKVPLQHGQSISPHSKAFAAKDLDQLELHGCELEFRISKLNKACENLQEDYDKIELNKENSKIHPVLQENFQRSLKLPVYKTMGS
ncbi:uncharacterized protein LOC125653590 [Ostrea edulis]|uniref:uncharacterized protein LOC125653590 n=1 Tax=Ostrea edulis TaxID=37623 RepID=UPI002094E57C|nr:uncharacterized protein LOC125653590 [Ostrea edulis]